MAGVRLGHIIRYMFILFFPHVGRAYNCLDAPACGIEMASYNGTVAYSNADCQCRTCTCANTVSPYGYQYSDLELVQRFTAINFGTENVWAGLGPVSIDACNHAPARCRVILSGQKTIIIPGDIGVWVNEPQGVSGNVAVTNY